MSVKSNQISYTFPHSQNGDLKTYAIKLQSLFTAKKGRMKQLSKTPFKVSAYHSF